MIKPYLGRNILEVGAGPGRISRLVLQDGVPFQGETGDLIPMGPFDTIFSSHVLEHVENDRQFLADCYQMLEPGGRLITLVPALQFLYSDLDRSIGHYRRYDKKMVRALVEGSGFRIQRLYYTNFIAVFASLIFLKLGKLDYQKDSTSKSRFVALERIYSRYFIPMIDLMERPQSDLRAGEVAKSFYGTNSREALPVKVPPERVILTPVIGPFATRRPPTKATPAPLGASGGALFWLYG
jgi:SAM-dependent methyltransferase